MTQPVQTFDSYDVVGDKEDLEDIIYDSSPIDTPFLTMCDRIEATSKKHEWQTDELADAAENAAVEGDVAAGTAIVPTVRPYNLTMISQDTIIVSGTEEEMDKAGRGSEMSYQIAKFSKALKESNCAPVAYKSATTTPEVPSMSATAWMTTATQPQPMVRRTLCLAPHAMGRTATCASKAFNCAPVAC